eukprot:TRINITY_DN18579_c0_g1_i1.p1 TRINITY_DN18579_c0_g1~~TRINITY_DN18579_c0_g1_i1.p1  ORF type:complete len:686 (+),score=110.02 TRINITY_DN18579_c0_g1_i1:64-2121(+)
MPPVCKKIDLPFVEPPTRLLRQFSDPSLYFVRLVEKIGRNNVKNKRVLVVTYDHLILAKSQTGQFTRYATNDHVAGILRKKISGKGDKGDGFVWQMLIRIPKEFDILCNFIADSNNEPMNETRTAKHFIEVMKRIHFSKFPDSSRVFDLEVAETDDLYKQGNFDRHEGYQSPMELLSKRSQRGKNSPSFSTSPTSPRGSVGGRRQLQIHVSPDNNNDELSFAGHTSPVSGFGGRDSSLGRTSPPVFQQQLRQQQQQPETYRKKQEEWIESIESENVNLKFKVLQFKKTKESTDKKISELQEQLNQLSTELQRERDARERDHVELIHLKTSPRQQAQRMSPAKKHREKITVDTQLVATDSETDENMSTTKSLRNSAKKRTSEGDTESCERRKTLPLKPPEEDKKKSPDKKKKQQKNNRLMSPTPPEEELTPPPRGQSGEPLSQASIRKLTLEGVSEGDIARLSEIGINSPSDMSYATYGDLANLFHHSVILKIIKAFGYKMGASPNEVLVPQNYSAPVGITPQLSPMSIQLTDTSPDGTGIVTENSNLRNMVAYLQTSLASLNAMDNNLVSPVTPPQVDPQPDTPSPNAPSSPDLVGTITDWPDDLPNYDAFLSKPDFKAFAVASDSITPPRKRPWGASWAQPSTDAAIKEAKAICLQKSSHCVVVFPTNARDPFGSSEGTGLHSI